MRIQITIRTKAAILDPAGRTIEGALQGLGYVDVSAVRQGRIIELDLPYDDVEKGKSTAAEMAKKLLVNAVMEDFEIRVLS